MRLILAAFALSRLSIFFNLTPGSAIAAPGAINGSPYRGIATSNNRRTLYPPVGGTVNSPGCSDSGTRG